jgi:hypothetical protein
MENENNVSPAGETPTPVESTPIQEASTEPVSLTLDEALELENAADEPATEAKPRAPNGRFAKAEGDEPEAEDTTEETPDGETEGDDGDEVSIIDGNAETRLRDGRKIKVAELKKAYDEAEQIRKAAPEIQKYAESVRAEAQRVAQQRQYFEQLVANFQMPQNAIPQPPSMDLLEADPIAYMQQKEMYEAAARVQQFQAQQQQVLQQQAREKAKADLHTHMKRESEKLLQAAPELKDPKKAQEFQKEFLETAKVYGFTSEDASNVYDHRLLLMVRELAQLRKQVSSAPQAIEQARARANSARPNEASPKGRVPASARKAEQVDALWKRAKSTGSLEDALRLENALDP